MTNEELTELIDKELGSKEQVEDFLMDVIMKYLEKLQGGAFGEPSVKDLLNAANLHNFLGGIRNEKA